MKAIAPPSPAELDVLFQGNAYGSVAQRLLANNMNPEALRTNTTLRKEEWIRMDETVVQVARTRLVAVGDLMNAGLTFPLANPLGTTVLENERVSDLNAAEVNMDGVTRSANDRVTFDLTYLPIPIIHKDFQLSIRVLEASRRKGQTLDVTQGELAAEKVSEKIEQLLMNGSGSLTFGGGTLYGYTDFPQRTTGSFSSGTWTASSATAASMVVDVLAMKSDAISDKHYGPWVLYVPTAYEVVLDEDYTSSTNTVTTIRQRLEAIEKITKVQVVDTLTADNIVLVEMQQRSVRMVVGMQPAPTEWDSKGGMITNYKVMAIMVPQIRADQEGQSGIVHYSA